MQCTLYQTGLATGTYSGFEPEGGKYFSRRVNIFFALRFTVFRHPLNEFLLTIVHLMRIKGFQRCNKDETRTKDETHTKDETSTNDETRTKDSKLQP